MRVFPYGIARIAARPLSMLSSFESDELIQCLDIITKSRRACEDLKTNLSRQLHVLIGQIKGRKDQNRLLTLRRAIHNDRRLTPTLLSHCRPFLSDPIQHQLNALLTIRADLETQHESGAQHYAALKVKCSQCLQELVEDPPFRKLVLAASPSFFRQLLRYADDANTLSNKKKRQTEITIWQFLSRSITKTSPFSAATHLAMVKLSSKATPGDYCSLPSSTVPQSSVLLNNRFLRVLKERLVGHPDVRPHLQVSLNPAMVDLEEGLHPLHLSVDSSLAQEVWTPLLAGVEAILDKSPVILYKDLLAGLQPSIPMLKKAADYVDLLIEKGILELGAELSVIDSEWISNWLPIIHSGSVHNPLMREVVRLLMDFGHEMKHYAESNARERSLLRQHCFEVFDTVCSKIYEDASKSPLERQLGSQDLRRIHQQLSEKLGRDGAQIMETEAGPEPSAIPSHLHAHHLFYEDFFWKDPIVMMQPALQPMLHSLEALYRAGWKSWYDKRMEHAVYFFKKWRKSERVPFTSFSQAFVIADREKKHLPKKSVYAAYWRQYETTVKAYAAMLKLPSSRDVSLTSADLPQAQADSEAPYSFNFFFQVHHSPQHNEPLMVINNINPGFGKWFSRFLHLFDPKMTASLSAWNTSLQDQDQVYAELNDVRTSNTGIHPPLLPYEIRYPRSLNRLPREHQIDVADIQICLDEKKERLKLMASSLQKEVKTFYLCFNSLPGHSPIFNFLSIFSDSRIFSQQTLLREINASHAQQVEVEGSKDPVVIYPRIVLDDRLVMQRRQWVIPIERVPMKQPGDTDWSYFLSINLWRRDIGIPSDAFVQLVTYGELRKLREQKKTSLPSDVHKPQFISFSNPISVQHFRAITTKVPRHLRVTEMIPGRNDGIEIGGSAYAAEFILQMQSDPRHG